MNTAIPSDNSTPCTVNDFDLLDGYARHPVSPPPDLIEAGREAAQAAVALLKMRKQRSGLKGILCSLRQHFSALADAAGVSIQGVLEQLRLPTSADLSATGAFAWARIASMLGLSPEEIDQRVRWEYAFGEYVPKCVTADARARDNASAPTATATPLDRLRAKEDTYTEPQCEELQTLRLAARRASSDET